MKWNFFALIPALGGALLCGCVSGGHQTITARVGPAPAFSQTAKPDCGNLVVYSAFKRNADFNSSDPNRPEHSDYRILTADGHLLRRVHNLSPTTMQSAVNVELAAGDYQVVARANGHGYLTIPIRIEAQRTTILHLEGGGGWPEESNFNETNSVRLTDGEIIGWRAAGN